jgi:hypothetical protein
MTKKSKIIIKCVAHLVNVGAHMDLFMLITWLELVIKYDTHDYNVIFYDMVTLKWEKNSCFHF